MWQRIRNWWTSTPDDAEFAARMEELRKRESVPVFWLIGKTQSGKTSIVKFLTGSNDAEIGLGFRPCTRFSREYVFPNADAPVIRFLDTRGIDEPGYDPAEDLARFGDQANVVIVTAKALDHAQGNLVHHLEAIRKAKPSRPVLLVLSCLHEAYPLQQHPPSYPLPLFDVHTNVGDYPAIPADLIRSMEMQRQRFEALADRMVAVDLTRPEDGYDQPTYGGDRLKEALLAMLPDVHRQTIQTLDAVSREWKDAHLRRVMPTVIGWSLLAATAGAVPIPFVDLLWLPGIYRRMIHNLAEELGDPSLATRFGELELAMQGSHTRRELLKVVPSIGSVAGAVYGGSSTFALGKAFCHYVAESRRGHTPTVEEMQRYFQEQVTAAEAAWKTGATLK
jgi:uncharacterized protein (DUF697 family)